MPNLEYGKNKTGQSVLLLKKGFLAKYRKNQNSEPKQQLKVQKVRTVAKVSSSTLPSTSVVPVIADYETIKQRVIRCVQSEVDGIPLVKLQGKIESLFSQYQICSTIIIVKYFPSIFRILCKNECRFWDTTLHHGLLRIRMSCPDNSRNSFWTLFNGGSHWAGRTLLWDHVEV